MDASILIAPGKKRKYLLGLLLTLTSWYAYSQSCNCPPPASCGPCLGGINGLTLQFNGSLLPALINALDGSTVVFSGLVNPGANFSFDGSLPDGRFSSNQVTLAVDGVYNTIIDTSCGSIVYINSSFGSFTVKGGTSKNGGALCCAVSDLDAIPPAISNCPSDITVSTSTTLCSSPATWAPPTASDNCGSVTLVGSHNPGATFSLGTTKVTYTATDSYGNTAICSFNVIVADKTPPTFNSCPANITVSANASCEAVATWIPPTATDLCSPPVRVTSSQQSGRTFPLGLTVVTYTATDDNGNSSTCSFNITVEDTTPPIFENCPTDISVSADANSCQAVVQWTAPTFSDNCQKGELTSSHLPGDVFPAGTTLVEYKATDVSGNVAYCSFNVLVKSDEPPVITGCPADINAEADESGEVSVTWTPPTATSTCGTVSLTNSHEPGDLFPVGVTKVEYIAVDDSGNEVPCTFDVTVSYKKVTLEVIQVVTPNGDGINDEWIITNLEQFSNNKVTIFDRWGSIIYSASGYNNDSVVWNGENKNGTLVPTGTYFYTIEVNFREQRVEKNGFFELVQ